MEKLKTLLKNVKNEINLRKELRRLDKMDISYISMNSCGENNIFKKDYIKSLKIKKEKGIDGEYIDHSSNTIFIKNKKYRIEELLFILYHESSHTVFKNIDRSKLKDIFKNLNRSGYIEEEIEYMLEEAFCDFMAIKKIGWVNYLTIIHRSETCEVIKRFRRTTLIKRYRLILKNKKLFEALYNDANFILDFK